MDSIEFEITGLPPAKNEALSMLGVGHSHAPRVRLLLEAALAATKAISFEEIVADPIGLDVVVYAPNERDPWDATNYLGGIADVLEHKGRRGSLQHLGPLGEVALYRNDRQIREVHYRQEVSEVARYRVRIWRLGAKLASTIPTHDGLH